jgi:hypothetical protein
MKKYHQSSHVGWMRCINVHMAVKKISWHTPENAKNQNSSILITKITQTAHKSYELTWKQRNRQYCMKLICKDSSESSNDHSLSLLFSIVLHQQHNQQHVVILQHYSRSLLVMSSVSFRFMLEVFQDCTCK